MGQETWNDDDTKILWLVQNVQNIGMVDTDIPYFMNQKDNN
jgi:hypothetical protein